MVERSEPGKCPGVETPCFRRAFARLLFTWDSRIVFENFKANESTAKASVSSPGNIPGEVSPTSLTRENPGSLEATGYEQMIQYSTIHSIISNITQQLQYNTSRVALPRSHTDSFGLPSELWWPLTPRIVNALGDPATSWAESGPKSNLCHFSRNWVQTTRLIMVKSSKQLWFNYVMGEINGLFTEKILPMITLRNFKKSAGAYLGPYRHRERSKREHKTSWESNPRWPPEA